MDGDGELDLVVGAPGVIGCVYVVLGRGQESSFNNNILTSFEGIENVSAGSGEISYIEEAANITVCGKEMFGR